jgi:flagellar M-ring protein FliF
MNQIAALFKRLTIAQRVWIATIAIAIGGGVWGLAHWNQERDFKPLFSGMAPEDAAPLLAKLRESAVEYRLTDGGSTVLVPSAKVAELRIDMASAGLPKSGRLGFELFDKTNFGASEFSEQVNYHRAIEGELERSIMSIREVETARVHLTLAKDSLYTEQKQPAKASVLVKLRHAAALSPQNVAAICQLTASAVPGLAPEQVSLVDTSGNLLNRPRPSDGADGEGSEVALEYRKSVERDLQNKIAATLEPLLGAEHFRTGVSAEVDFTSGELSEEVFDPTKSVMTTSQRTDDGPAVQAASGVPGTASNLPRPAAKTVTGSSNYQRHTENISYQTSRTVKHTRLPQGAVKRLSVSILVDHALHWDGARRVIEPPSPDKLKVIKDLVSAASGIDGTRGDQLVVEAFPFEATLQAEPPHPEPSSTSAPQAAQNQLPKWMQPLMQKNGIVIGAIGAVALAVLVGGVFFAIRSARKNKQLRVEQTPAIEAGKTPTPEEITKQIESKLADQAAEKARQEVEQLMALKIPVVKTKKTEVLTKHIATEAKQEAGNMAHVVRTWLNG